MKIKEVTTITGLSEKTIRFYEEKQLFTPEVHMIGNRKFREYTEENVKELETIASLRKAFFTIEEIKLMKESPNQIPSIMNAYHFRITEDIQAKTKVINSLEQASYCDTETLDSIVVKIAQISEELPLPNTDIKPNFAKLDRQNTLVTMLVDQRVYTKYSLIPKKITDIEILILYHVWNKPNVTFTDLVHACGETIRMNTDCLDKILHKMCKKHLLQKTNGHYEALIEPIYVAPKDIDRLVQVFVAGSPSMFVYSGQVPMGVTSRGYGPC